MKRATLALLRCPRCHGELQLHNEARAEQVEAGFLLCSVCAQQFPIEQGIPRFICPEELEGLNRRYARLYDRFSYGYALFTKVAFLPFGGERKARKEILDRLELKGGRVLEVSIGPGVNLPYLYESPAVGEVFGLDISWGQLARCRRFSASRGWPVDLFLGMAEALPFQADTFDSVFHIGGINFFSGKQQAIDEMIRVAQPGAKIVIADEAERLARAFARLPGSARSLPAEQVDTATPVHLVPETMEEIQVDRIWKGHGRYHGYCLTFRKPT